MDDVNQGLPKFDIQLEEMQIVDMVEILFSADAVFKQCALFYKMLGNVFILFLIEKIFNGNYR